MKKKGFTLIELLAVIVILAVIALIATPLIMGIINDAKKNSFKDSAYGITKAVELRAAKEQIDNVDGKNVAYKIDVTSDAINYNGEKPTSGWAYIDENGNIELYMCNSSCCAKKGLTDKEVTVTSDSTEMETVASEIERVSKLDVAELIAAPVSFETDSWKIINQAVKSNNLSAYSVGDTKEVTMDVNDDGTDETYHIMVVNTTECTTETSETACGLVLQFQELLNITNNENKKMNSTDTSVGGWPATLMRTYLNGAVYNKLKDVIGDIIVETTVISGHEKEKTENYTSKDHLYLLSPKEVGVDGVNDSAKEETRKLDYYSDDSVSMVKYKYGTTEATYWWLRAADFNNAHLFYDIGGDGVYHTFWPTGLGGVSPAFRVGK